MIFLPFFQYHRIVVKFYRFTGLQVYMHLLTKTYKRINFSNSSNCRYIKLQVYMQLSIKTYTFFWVFKNQKRFANDYCDKRFTSLQVYMKLLILCRRTLLRFPIFTIRVYKFSSLHDLWILNFLGINL